jgi:hypothetical protein
MSGWCGPLTAHAQARVDRIAAEADQEEATRIGGRRRWLRTGLAVSAETLAERALCGEPWSASVTGVRAAAETVIGLRREMEADLDALTARLAGGPSGGAR